MLYSIARNWWVLSVRGIAALLFGGLALTWPEITLLAFLLLFAAFALVDGVTAIGLAWAGRGPERAWWEMLLVGLLGLSAVAIAFVAPDMTPVSLMLVIASWAIARGIFELGAAMQMHDVFRHEWLLGMGGLVSIVFGVLLLAWPAAGVLAVRWLVAAYALLFGAVSLAFSWQLHEVKHRMDASRV